MRPPAPMTPRRTVSFAPSTRVEASAVSPLAMRKLRRLSIEPLSSSFFAEIYQLQFRAKRAYQKTGEGPESGRKSHGPQKPPPQQDFLSFTKLGAPSFALFAKGGRDRR